MTGLSLVGAALVAAAPSEARVAVVIGSDVGLEDEPPLSYAEEDARRFHRLLVEAGGVEPERAYLSLGQPAPVVERVLAEAAGRVEELARLGPVAFLVYASSHADAEDLHLEGTRLPIERIRARLARSPARLRLTIVDACRTAVKEKGGRPGPPVGVRLDRPSHVEGDIFIAAAGMGEPAQEWGLLSGSLFSHHLLTGLRGAADTDGDRAVSLAEAYTYSYRRTAARSIEGAGAQHPSFEFRTSGWGEWAFTRPAGYAATLVLGEDLEGRFWVSSRQDELVAEVAKARGEVVRIGLSPGIYRVARPDGRFAWVGDVNLAFGGSRTVTGSSLDRVPLRDAALRGSRAVELHPWRLLAAYRIASGTVSGLDVQHFGELGLGRDLGPWFLRWDLGLGRDGFATVDGVLVGHLTARTALAFGRALPVGFGSVQLGLGGSVAWINQSLEFPDQEVIERVFGPLDRERSAWVLGGFVLVGSAMPLFDDLALAAEIQGSLEQVPLGGEGGLRPGAGVRIGLEWSL